MRRTQILNNWILLLAVAFCGLVYLPHINAPFIWDDLPTIAWNSAFDHAIPAKNFVNHEYFRFAQEQFWRPVTTLSYYLLSVNIGKSPWIFRLLSLALHGANAALLALILRGLGFRPETYCTAAGLFLVNAAHTETIICSTFNQELLCAFGILWMIRAHQQGRIWPAAFGFAFGLLAKEPGAVALPLAMLYDVCAGAPAAPDIKSILEILKAKWTAYALYGTILLFYLWFQFIHLRSPGAHMGAAAHLAASERLFYGLEGLVDAVRVFLAPVRLRVEYFAIPPDSFVEWIAWPATGLLLLGLWGWALLRAWRTDLKLFFCLIWPLPFLALTSGLFPVAIFNMRVMAERWLYLPGLGAAAALGIWFPGRPRLAALVICFWSACGVIRAGDWSRESRLYESLVSVYPWSAKAREGLGEAYFHEDRMNDSINALQAALKLRETGEDKIIAHYSSGPGAPVEKSAPSIYRWIGHAYVRMGDLNKADENFRTAVSLDPNDGFSYQIMAYSWAERNRFDRAQEWLAAGLRINPQNEFLLRLKPGIEAHHLPFQTRFY